MAKEVTIWYDLEGDYLEIIFERKAGYFKETDHEAIMQKVDSAGNLLGFSVLGVSQLQQQPTWSMPLLVLMNVVRLKEKASKQFAPTDLLSQLVMS